MNILRTGILMAAMTALFLVVGYAIGGQTGMAIAFVFAAGSNLFAYWNSDKMVLRMYGAREVDARTAPDLVHLVTTLADRAGLPMPKVYIVDNPQPNAFATGRNPENAAVCVTTGLMSHVGNEELAGVLAHELSHIKHRDTLTMTITATIAGAISMLANFAMFAGMFGGFGGGNDNRNNPLGGLGMILVAIMAPIAAMLVQMAISRTREYEADREGAEISGRPLWLASALAEDRARGRGHRQQGRRYPSGDGASLHHQPAAWRHGRIVREPSLDRRACGAPQCHGRTHGAGRAQAEPVVVTDAPAGLAVTHRGTSHSGRGVAQAPSARCRQSIPFWARATLEPRDAGFARAIAGETLRRFGQLDALIRGFVPKPPPPHKAGPTLELLMAGACELLFLNVAAHAAVDAANRLAMRDAKAKHFKPLINAVLRRVSREGTDAIAAQDAARLNTPDWLWTRWCEAYGEEARARHRRHACAAAAASIW